MSASHVSATVYTSHVPAIGAAIDLANRLHDSVLQTLQIIRNTADDADEVRYLARRQERELRRLIEDYRSPYERSFRSALLRARDDVEDLFRVEIEGVVRGDAEVDDRLDAIIDASREAMVNAAKHSGATRFDLYAEVGDRNAVVYIRDRGEGWEPYQWDYNEDVFITYDQLNTALSRLALLIPDPDPPRISDAEWSVMRTLWHLGESRAGQIIADLTDRTDWKPKTIQTLIRRLVQKGLIEFEQSGRERLYRAAISEQECQLQASRNFLDRVFDGELAPFLANFAGRGRGLSDAEIAELKKILEEPDDE